MLDVQFPIPKDRFWIISIPLHTLACSLSITLTVVIDSVVPVIIYFAFFLGYVIFTRSIGHLWYACHVEECDNYCWVGRLYRFTCNSHKCRYQYERCNNFVLQPNSICSKHACQRESCTNPITTPGKTFCDRHACLSRTCRKRCHPGLRVCLDHKCEMCDGYGIHSILDGDNSRNYLVCSDHLPCSTENCNDIRVPGLDVCETCNELEIMTEPPPTYANAKSSI